MNHKKKPIRVVFLYSSGHFGSTVVLNHLIELDGVEVVGMVRTPAIRSVKSFFHDCGSVLGWHHSFLLFLQRWVQGISLLISGVCPLLYRRLKPGWLVCRRFRIPAIRCQSINHDDAHAFIQNAQPDIIVSAYFNQILGKEVLAIPEIGSINVHPGYLPRCRGAMSYFWTLTDETIPAGVSLHWMDEGIDTGSLISRRRLRYDDYTTQQQLMVKTAVIGSRLLGRILVRLSEGKSVPIIDTSHEAMHYYTVPRREAFTRYIQKRRFFRVFDIVSFVFRRLK